MSDQGKAYELCCERLFKALVGWRIQNAGKEVQVVWHFPRNVAIIATIGDALKHGYVSANPAGLELIQAMVAAAGSPANEPTVLMIRTIMEESL